MANQRAFGFTRVLATGAPVPNAGVAIYNAGTLTLSTIFSDTIGTVKPNPFTSDANGYWFFYAANSRYDVTMATVTGPFVPGAPTNYTLGDIELASFVSLNGLTGDTQTFATGTTGADFNISSVTATHTFNLPDAGAAARGAVTTAAQTFAGAKTFSTPIALGSGGTGITTAPTSGQTLLGTAGGLWTVGTIAGTANQVTVTTGSGTLTLSTPQNIHTGANVTFNSLTLAGLSFGHSMIFATTGGLITNTVIAGAGQFLVGQAGVDPVLGTIVGTGGTTATFAGSTWTINSPSSTGITSLNGLSGASQTFAVGTSGSDFGVSSIGSVHTFNIPDAAATARGLITTGTQILAGAKTFNGAVTLAGGFSQTGGAAATIQLGSGAATGTLMTRQSTNSTATPTSGTGLTTLHTYTLKANSLAVNGQIAKIRGHGNINTSHAAAFTINSVFGGTSLAIASASTNLSGDFLIEVEIIRTGSAAEFRSATIISGTGVLNIIPVHDSPAIDLTVDQTFLINAQVGNAGDTIQLYMSYLMVLL